MSRSALAPPMITATRFLELIYEHAHEMHFQLQFHAEPFDDASANAREQRRNVLGRSAAKVIDEVGMQRRDFRAALPPSLSSGRFDEARSFVAGRIAKARACVRQ